MLTQANIHEWTSHLNLRKFSGLENEKVKSGPLGSWASFFTWLPEPSAGIVCTLCRTGSEFLTTIFCPVWTAKMEGTYSQPFWSSANGGAEAPVDLPLMPSKETTTSASPPLPPTT